MQRGKQTSVKNELTVKTRGDKTTEKTTGGGRGTGLPDSNHAGGPQRGTTNQELRAKREHFPYVSVGNYESGILPGGLPRWGSVLQSGVQGRPRKVYKRQRTVCPQGGGKLKQGSDKAATGPWGV